MSDDPSGSPALVGRPLGAIGGILLLLALAAPVTAGAVEGSHGTGSSSIHGTVTAPGGGLPDASVTVQAYAPGVHNETITVDPATGTYEFVDMPAGDYILTFEYLGASNFVQSVRWPAGTGSSPGTVIPIAAAETLDRDFVLIPGVRIAGQVSTSDGSALASASVLFQMPDGWATSLAVGGDGGYQASQLPPGDYRVRFSASGRTTEFWDDVLTSSAATVLTLPSGTEATGIDAILEPAVSLSGTVQLEEADGDLVPYTGRVAFRRTGTTFVFDDVVDSTGRFSVTGLQPGSFEICFGSRYVEVGASLELPNCWGGGSTFDDAEPVVLDRGENRTDLDAVIRLGGGITASLVTRAGPAGPLQPVADGVYARLWVLDEEDGTWRLGRETLVPSGGHVALYPLEPGRYTLELRDSLGRYNTEY
jgi:hypothetical protein